MRTKKILLFAGVSIIGLFLGFFIGCTQTPKSGPIEIKYNRDQCAECGMVISDKRFSAQIRGGPDREHKAYLFDDIGCAIKFSKKQSWINESSTEFLVSDYETGKWLNARSAMYEKAKSSPMNYGYSAHELKKDGRIEFTEAATRIGEGK